jgi:hypothetical protein
MRSVLYLCSVLLCAALPWGCMDSSESGSPDLGETWTKQISGTTEPLNAVAWGGQWVAVGSGGTVLTSPNGITWTPRSSGTALPLNDLIYTGQQWVAIGAGGVVLTSPDGITWTERTSGTPAILNSIVHAGTQFVIVGWDGIILTSPDAMTWTERLPVLGRQDSVHGGEGGILGGEDLHSVAWTGSHLVAVGHHGSVLTSPDGITWTERSSGTTSALTSVVWDGKQLVAASTFGELFTSPDAITWTPRAAFEANLNFMDRTGKKFFAVGYEGLLLSSSDGLAWKRDTVESHLVLYSVAEHNKQLVTVGYNGEIWTSP